MTKSRPAAARRRPTGGTLLIIAAVLLGAMILTPTVNQLIAQRERIAEIESAIATATAEASRLETELARWDDPAYVKTQARGRLLFITPGDTTYVVLDANADKTPAKPVEVAVEQHETRSDPAALYLDSLIKSATADAPAAPEETK